MFHPSGPFRPGWMGDWNPADGMTIGNPADEMDWDSIFRPGWMDPIFKTD